MLCILVACFVFQLDALYFSCIFCISIAYFVSQSSVNFSFSFFFFLLYIIYYSVEGPWRDTVKIFQAINCTIYWLSSLFNICNKNRLLWVKKMSQTKMAYSKREQKTLLIVGVTWGFHLQLMNASPDAIFRVNAGIISWWRHQFSWR